MVGVAQSAAAELLAGRLDDLILALQRGDTHSATEILASAYDDAAAEAAPAFSDHLQAAIADVFTDSFLDLLGPGSPSVTPPRPPSAGAPRPTSVPQLPDLPPPPDSRAPSIAAALGIDPADPIDPTDPVWDLDRLLRGTDDELALTHSEWLDALRGLGRRPVRRYPQLPPVADALLRRFNPRVAREADWHTYRAIVGLTSEQRSAVRRAVTAAVSPPSPLRPELLARVLARSVGLNGAWQRSAAAYLSTIAHLPPATVERLYTAHTRNLIAQRALLIARTETMRAANSGRRLSWSVATRIDLLDGDRAAVQWLVGPSGWAGIDVCERCAPMADKVTTVGGGFDYTTRRSHGFLSGPPLHPACRCSTRILPDHFAADRAELQGPLDPATDPSAATDPTDPARHLVPAATVPEAQRRVQRYLDEINGVDPADLVSPIDRLDGKPGLPDLTLTDDPVHAEVLAEAAQYVFERPVVELSELSVDQANGLLEALAIYDRIGLRPVIAERLRMISGPSLYQDHRPQGLGPNSYAEALTLDWGSIVAMRPAAYDDAAGLRRGVVSGFHPPGSDTWTGIWAHEFGHVLDMGMRAADEADDSTAHAERMRDAIIRALASDHPVLDFNRAAALYRRSADNYRLKLAEALSTYATENNKEAVAEAVAEALLAPDPRPVARAVLAALWDSLRALYTTLPDAPTLPLR